MASANSGKKKSAAHFLNRIKKKDAFVVFCVFVFLVVLFTFITINEALSSIRTRRFEAENLAVVYGSEVERNCNRTFQLNGTVASLIALNENTEQNFIKLAEHLMPDFPAADCVQLAPDGIVTQVYPLKGNESVLGHNLFADEKRADEAVKTKESGSFTIGGPYPLLQGGEGFIARFPVFLDDAKSDFWGFVNVVVRVEKIMETVNFSGLTKHGYNYSIYRIKDSGEILPIAGTDFYSLKKPVRHQLNMPNARWELAIAPRGLWINIHFTIILVTLSLLIITAFTILTFLFFRLQKSNTRLAQLASTDQLTGLYSKQTALFSLKREISIAERIGSKVAVCFIDMNDFKTINDTFGHTTGDAALVKVARRISESVRQDDIVARFGGDEFLVISRGKNIDCEGLVARIDSALNVPAKFGGHSLADISAAIGFAVYPDDAQNADDLIKAADSAMYKAKYQRKFLRKQEIL